MTTTPRYWAVIPAAGIGERFGGDTPKQYADLNNKTVIEHTLATFLCCNAIAGVVVALHKDDQYFEQLEFAHSSKPLWTTIGGQSRAHSVLNALVYLQDYAQENDFVLVHDAARPCLTQNDLNTLLEVCVNDSVGGILGVPVCDTLKKVKNNAITDTVKREHLWRALTPQMFNYKLLVGALTTSLQNNIEITDEAAAIEYQGYQPKIIYGDARNIKITTQEDLHLAALYLQDINHG